MSPLRSFESPFPYGNLLYFFLARFSPVEVVVYVPHLSVFISAHRACRWRRITTRWSCMLRRWAATPRKRINGRSRRSTRARASWDMYVHCVLCINLVVAGAPVVAMSRALLFYVMADSHAYTGSSKSDIYVCHVVVAYHVYAINHRALPSHVCLSLCFLLRRPASSTRSAAITTAR